MLFYKLLVVQRVQHSAFQRETEMENEMWYFQNVIGGIFLLLHFERESGSSS